MWYNTKKRLLWKPVMYITSLILHVLFIVYGDWQDLNYYEVFTDASEHVSNNTSPYERHTYRYTPLLAWILLPNVLWVKTFGKFLFSAANLYVGYMLDTIKQTHTKTIMISKSENSSSYGSLGLIPLAFWLLNPFVIVIATRGNADIIPVLLVLGTLKALSNEYWIYGGFIFGLAVHFKIYPVIFGIPFLLYINPYYKFKTFYKLSSSQWKFLTSSLIIFFSLTAYFYSLYGFRFLYETYLYHLIRADHRHNFSPAFYILYLSHLIPSYRKALALILFLPQWITCLFIGCYYSRQNISFACLLQTLIFVTFNKVCTSQYFIWWISLLPLFMKKMVFYFSWKRTLFYISFWVGSQALWLRKAYNLEFQGQSDFIYLWIASLIFFFSHIALITHLIDYHNRVVQGEAKSE